MRTGQVLEFMRQRLARQDHRADTLAHPPKHTRGKWIKLQKGSHMSDRRTSDYRRIPSQTGANTRRQVKQQRNQSAETPSLGRGGGRRGKQEVQRRGQTQIGDTDRHRGTNKGEIPADQTEAHTGIQTGRSGKQTGEGHGNISEHTSLMRDRERHYREHI